MVGRGADASRCAHFHLEICKSTEEYRCEPVIYLFQFNDSHHSLHTAIISYEFIVSVPFQRHQILFISLCTEIYTIGSNPLIDSINWFV